eukprot:m.256040 g.256040  ORF g.256040 m.256040 type:complete len:56 (-) comp15512_c0_seq12:1163-1330(-)
MPMTIFERHYVHAKMSFMWQMAHVVCGLMSVLHMEFAACDLLSYGRCSLVSSRSM